MQSGSVIDLANGSPALTAVALVEQEARSLASDRSGVTNRWPTAGTAPMVTLGIESMTDLTTLRDLEKRLQEAMGPDRELDDAVFRACGLKVYPYDEPSGTTWGDAYPVTKSLDAAIALVERLDFLQWHVDTMNLGAYAEVYGRNCVFGSSVDICRTPALALCLALARAMIARGEP